MSLERCLILGVRSCFCDKLKGLIDNFSSLFCEVIIACQGVLLLVCKVLLILFYIHSSGRHKNLFIVLLWSQNEPHMHHASEAPPTVTAVGQLFWKGTSNHLHCRQTSQENTCQQHWNKLQRMSDCVGRPAPSVIRSVTISWFHSATTFSDRPTSDAEPWIY